MPLTDLKIRTTKATDKPVRLADSGGLMIEIRPNGSKLWRYRYRIAGKASMFAIGDYPTVSLQEARKARDNARDLVKQGINPSQHRQENKQANIEVGKNTFRALAEEFLEKKKSAWSPKYHEQVKRLLAANAYPEFGKLPIRAVDAGHVLSAMRKMEERGAKTFAILLRQVVSAIFCYATATLRANGDPASALKGAVMRDRVEHAQPINDIANYKARLAEFGGNRTTAIALQLILLTFVRTAELRLAEWTEFDLDRAEWVIPAGRMKKRRPHVVPLSPQAVALLRELHRLTGGQQYLFPNTRRPEQCMSATTINRALEYLGYETGTVTAHDFRATASTRLYESGKFRGEVIEMQLAHADKNKTRASYNHAQYLAERRELMQWWADWVDSQQAA